MHVHQEYVKEKMSTSELEIKYIKTAKLPLKLN